MGRTEARSIAARRKSAPGENSSGKKEPLVGLLSLSAFIHFAPVRYIDNENHEDIVFYIADDATITNSIAPKTGHIADKSSPI